MRSTSVLFILSVAATVSPVLSAPVPKTGVPIRERSSTIDDIEDLLKGLATGGSLGAGLAGAEDVLGGDDNSQSQRRRQSGADARALTGLGSPFGLSSPIDDEIEKIMNFFNEVTRVKRNLQAREPSRNRRSGLSSLFDGLADDTIDAIKNGAASGIGSAVGGSVIDGVIDHFTGDKNTSSKRDNLEARQPLSSSGRTALGHLVDLGVSTIAGDAIDGIEGLFDGSSNSTSSTKIKREILSALLSDLD